MKFNDGSVYEGEFSDDNLQGWGIIQYANGNHYSGQFVQDKMDGYGEYYAVNGDTFVGEWKQDQKYGFGILHVPQPKKLIIGFWKQNLQHGVGSIITEKYVKFGLWKNGERLKWIRSYSDAINKIKRYCGTEEFIEYFPRDEKHAKEILNFF